MSNPVVAQIESMSSALPGRHAKYVKIAEQDVEMPLRERSRNPPRPRMLFYGRDGHILGARQIDDGPTTEPGEIVPITLTRSMKTDIKDLNKQAEITELAFYSTISRPTPPLTLPSLATATPASSTVSRTSSSWSSTTFSSAPPTSTSHTITPASPPGFPTALVASLATLIPVSFIVTFLFYLFYRRRSKDEVPEAKRTSSLPTFNRGGGDNYVWGPLGLIRRHEKDKENPVLRAQETQARIDPIAEAIREEEKERLARQRRSGEARFYAPGVRHLVEYVGSRERMKVIIDWRDKLKMDRPW